MNGRLKKVVLTFISFVALCCAGPTESIAGEATLLTNFDLNSSAFSKQFYVYRPGSITVEVKWLTPEVLLSVMLKRPNGSVASQTSGGGGSLTLSYAATQQEVISSLSANFIKWKLEVSSRSGSPNVSGKLRIAYPWDVIQIANSKQFKLGPLGDVPVDQYSHSEYFSVLAPGTIRVKAYWTPQGVLGSKLIQNTVGAAIQTSNQGPFEVSHHVGEQNLSIAAWNCTFQNLSQQKVLVTLSITFVPDR